MEKQTNKINLIEAEKTNEQLEQTHTTNKKEETSEIKKNRISIWRIFVYFIIYSVIGFIIETIFALVNYNVLESRQSFLYGPFLRNIWSRSSSNDILITIFQEK